MASSHPSKSLADALASVLPKNHAYTIYHISTPPTRCDPIYSPPPNTKPERTFCESHLLQVSIGSAGEEVFILAIECLVYSTRYATTLFVSKADSTGYISQPNASTTKTSVNGSATSSLRSESPLRTIARAFIAWLIAHRVRPNIKLILSLFARASAQYLYPGSSENVGKHVLDDRQLVRWWCRVLGPLIEDYAPEASPSNPIISNKSTSSTLPTPPSTCPSSSNTTTAQAYLIIPGEDSITPYLPPNTRSNPSLRARWTHGHPLQKLSRHAHAPPRCLIPHFPDDPKARYLTELDDELPDAGSQGTEASPRKRGTGAWKSVKSLDMFWEMMAYRSECAAGRMVGFLWIVFTPPSSPFSDTNASTIPSTSLSTPRPKAIQPPKTPMKTPLPTRQTKKRRTGRVPIKLPHILRPSRINAQADTPWYTWPTTSRGRVVLSEAQYQRAHDLLLRLDFSTSQVAAESTRTWIVELGVLAGEKGEWSIQITGALAPPKETNAEANGMSAVNVLGVKRKKGADAPEITTLEVKRPKVDAAEPAAVNVLGAGMVRKKPKKVAPMTVS
ncbi:hypothetical protein BT63DRAFT_430446 [Microthyrium microscopicum]|uniref:histone acetyltransferase n=1 Tax=Microthyrium microscopicum TaxID=703497 RepID=A0A6A6TWL0_9PEZI|nr:hypothetical protein BT63DRAFT_430446 [Microthyrium microscopicum]